MFVVSVPYGVCSIKLAKQPSTQKKEKKNTTKDHSLVKISSI